MTLRYLAKGPDDICVSLDRMKELPGRCEYADELIGTS